MDLAGHSRHGSGGCQGAFFWGCPGGVFEWPAVLPLFLVRNDDVDSVRAIAAGRDAQPRAEPQARYQGLLSAFDSAAVSSRSWPALPDHPARCDLLHGHLLPATRRRVVHHAAAAAALGFPRDSADAD